MKSKLMKKIICALLLIMTLISFGSNNFVSAITSAYIQKIGDADHHLKHNGSYVQISVVGHYQNGVFYPAYCLNVNLAGAETGPYDVAINQALNNDAVWRVLVNAFPYKSAAEMGLQNDFDAFAVTKMAVYCVIGQSDVNSFSADPSDGTGQAMLSILHNLVNIGFNGSGSPSTGTLSATKVGELTEAGNYWYQTYRADSSIGLANYTVTNIAGFPEGTYVANTSGGAQNTFGQGEEFRLMIPKSGFGSDINGNIYITGKCKVYPILYGESRDPSKQDYIVTTDPYGDDSTVIGLNIKTNTAKIQINKTDDYTHLPIEGVTFELSKSDGTVIGTATTNKEGIIVFEHLYQGTYILRETATNEKYILRVDDLETTTEFNKTTTMNIENEHKKGNLRVYKVDKDNNKVDLGNVEFDLYSEEFGEVIGTYHTSVDGEIYIEGLRIGNYSLIEKKTNRWYNLAEDTDIVVEWDLTTDTTIENELKKGQIKIIKVDSENNEIKLQGVTFEVYDEDGNLLETLVTDENGETLTNKYAVRDFEKLYVKETSTLQNYVLNDQVQEIVIEANQITTMKFENDKIKGTIKILKVSNGNNELLNIPDGTPLAGAKFEIKDSNGNVVGVYETDATGTITLENQLYGEYTIREIEAPDGFVLDTESQTAFIKENGQTIELTFKNSPKLPKTGNDFYFFNFISSLMVAFFSIVVITTKIVKRKEVKKYE